MLTKPANRLRILCGDFNTPQTELVDGTVITWGQRIRNDGSVVMKRRIRGNPGASWEKAERSVLTGLAEYDLHDVFRQLHGYGVADDIRAAGFSQDVLDALNLVTHQNELPYSKNVKRREEALRRLGKTDGR